MARKSLTRRQQIDLAREAIMASLATAAARVYEGHLGIGLSEKDNRAVCDQIQKDADRLARVIGYEGCSQV